MRTPESTVELHGIVVNTVDIGERDRLFQLLTAERGLLTVYANGARLLKNRYLTTTQLFCYGRYFLSEKNGRYTVQDVTLEESFYDLRREVDRAALGAYICEVATYTGTEIPDTELLRLILNTLYAVSRGLFDLTLIKAAFEFRMATELGFMPDLSACDVCGTTKGEFIFDLSAGNLICRDCRDTLTARALYEEGTAEHRIEVLTPGVRAAVEYVLSAPPERLFSFRLEKDDLRSFAHAAEDYLIWHTDHKFSTLEFYHQVAL